MGTKRRNKRIYKHHCFFQAEDGIRDSSVTGVQTCALPISLSRPSGLPLLLRELRVRISWSQLGDDSKPIRGGFVEERNALAIDRKAPDLVNRCRRRVLRDRRDLGAMIIEPNYPVISHRFDQRHRAATLERRVDQDVLGAHAEHAWLVLRWCLTKRIRGDIKIDAVVAKPQRSCLALQRSVKQVHARRAQERSNKQS